MRNLNADSHEIQKFDAIQDDWWNPQGQCAPLHHINPLRMAFIQQHVNLKNKNILDAGCGGGILTEALAQAGGHVTGIDLSQHALKAAQQHNAHRLNIYYICASVEDFAEQHPERFDVITCMEMLEHVPDPASCIQALSKLIKPQGKLFFSTINRNIKSYLFAIMGAEWILKLIPKGTHDYAKFIRPSELAQWLREANLNMQALCGLTYNPLARKYSLEPKDLSVNYLAAAEKI